MGLWEMPVVDAGLSQKTKAPSMALEAAPRAAAQKQAAAAKAPAVAPSYLRSWSKLATIGIYPKDESRCDFRKTHSFRSLNEKKGALQSPHRCVGMISPRRDGS